MPRGPNHQTPKRSRTLALVDLGLSQSEISRRVGIPQQTISRWSIAQHERCKKSSGRRRSITEEEVDQVIAIIRSGWEGRKLCWRKLTVAANLRVHPKTLQRALQRRGYHRCKAC